MTEQQMTNQQQPTVPKKVVRMIVAAALMGFAGIMSETAMNVTFPKLSQIFHVSMETLAWVTTIYLLMVAIMMTLSAYLRRRFSQRQLFLASVGIFVIGTLIGGTAVTFPILLVGRVLQGVAAGIALPLTFNIILEQVPLAKLGTWMGFGSLVVSIAPSIGPTYGGLLVDSLGWRAIFFFVLLLVAVSFFLGITSFEKKEPIDKTAKLDWLQFLLLACSLTTSLIFVSGLETGKVNLPVLVLFFATFFLFIWKSLTSKQEFLNIRLFAKPVFLYAIIPFVLYQFANIGGNYLIPNYLQLGFGVSSILAGFALLPGSLLAALLNPWFGKLYDERGAKLPLYLGNLLFTISLLVMCLFAHSLGMVLLTIIYVIFSFGRVMAFGNIQTTTIAHLSKEEGPHALALFQMMNQYGGSIGTAVVALISSSQANIKDAFQQTNLLFITFGLVSFGLFFLMFRTKEYTAPVQTEKPSNEI
ncbi:MFS transporter [Enterococcus italicus]|uniref:MFS transporter n=1 Tax=Enterococcus italicus TaxID=246144 RepID=UPI00207348EE|nr:MFS transporter [Enterococcus italicus]